ncbi:hypothetical protein QEM13_001997 [Pseudomonas putida]|nr:hypothetical protein [Pseudomonas putida]
MSTEFKREDRYIVIKRSDLANVPVNYRSSLVEPMLSLLSHLPSRECLVIESDWPEYEPTWAAIEARVTGKPSDDIPDFTPGNGNKAERRATELVAQLQADLTERDEMIDQLRSGYVFETGPYEVELSDAQWSAALGVFENYNMGDDRHFVFLEEQGRGVISEILIEIGVARAPDADEVAE